MSLFETQSCSRCGGTGHFSYCQRWGTVCFKCGGGKVVHTKRGAQASALFNRLLSKPVSTLQPGDKFRDVGVTHGGDLYRKWFTVISVTPERVEWSESGIEKSYEAVKVVSDGCIFSGRKADAMVRISADAKVKQWAATIALSYQEILSKSGKEPAWLKTVAWG